MASPAPAIDAELEAVTAALAAVEPRTKRLLLFGSRARGDARPDSDFDVLVVGAADAERLAGSRWYGVARALREGRELHVAG
jgi:predicted nucleotidyltransferase